jgi:predicted RND superfamily exporter protein
MDFGTVKGVVYIRGVFQISHPTPDGDEEKMKNLTINTLYSLEKKVRGIPGVSDVIFQLLNWRKERGQWVPIEMKKKEEEDENKTESDV